MLRELKRSFKAEQMAVFTEGQNDRWPALGRGISVHIRSEPMPAPSTEDSAEEDVLENAADHRPTRVHAKAYLAESKSGSGTLFFGSANCTQPALMRSVSDGGNVELLVASALDQRAVAAVRADLTDLFKPARDTAAIARRCRADPCLRTARGDETQDAGAIARPRARLAIEAERVAARPGLFFVNESSQGSRP